MKLFMVLLALRLTAAEKLDRRYLPPPGAKLSGGRSDDLQTPLEYPKKTPSYGTRGYGSYVFAADDSDNVKIRTPDENELSMVTNGHYYDSFSNLRSGFDTGHMPIIAVPESIGQNYQPQLFGMYGGNPMSIKYFDNNIEMVGSGDLITTDEKIINLKAEQYIPTTPKPNKGAVTTLERNGQKLFFKKFERPQANLDRSAVVLNYENVQNPDGYFYNFETSNGIHRDESASTLNGVNAKGSYSYKGDDGKFYTVTYTADENGFQPSGDHLPPIPEAIQNVIEQAQREKDTAGIFDDGSYDETKYGHMKYQGPVHRYMLKNVKNHKRKKVSGEQKIFERSKIKKIETSNIVNTENFETEIIKNGKPFGMRRVEPFDNSRNEEDAIYIQSPKTKENQNYTSDYDQKVNNNKDVSNSTVLQNIQHNRGTLNSNKEKNLKNPGIQDGYYYVPPENVFIDGIYQDKLFTDTYLNKSVLETEFNTVERRNETDEFSDIDLSKMTQFITSTEKPFYPQTYDGDFYGSTNADVDQLIDHTRTTVIASSSKKSGTKTTAQLYGNTFTTNPYDNEFTKEIVQAEETVIPENGVETIFMSSQNDFNTADYQSQSTTPMPLEARTYENTNQYETTSSESALTSSNFDVDDSKNEGYFKSTPEKTATFENFPFSPYSPFIYTTEGIVNTESTTSVQIDEFGRTRQESVSYFTDSSIDSFTNKMQSDTESKASTPNDDYDETFRTDQHTTLDNKSITQFPNEFGSDVYETPDDLHIGRDVIIGEDFSGPKQPQRYDPKKGYYY